MNYQLILDSYDVMRGSSAILILPVIVVLFGLLIAGCDAPIDAFNSNEIFAKRFELTTDSLVMDEPTEDAAVLLEELFGTPDDPKWPAFLSDDRSEPLVSQDRLRRAAGAVSSDEDGRHSGLFREHCVVCHGVSGDGLGPSAALLNPYPRDFRMGRFKFKSTPIGKKPTRHDLRRLLLNGIVGTSMPSFQQLEHESDESIESLIDYIIYLSVRGELERRLLMDAAMDLDIESGEQLYDPAMKESDADGFERVWSKIESVAIKVEESWKAADEQTIKVKGPPEGFALLGAHTDSSIAVAESIANGKKLFQGNVASCAFCHGMDAMGDGQQVNYDDWTRDWTALAGLNPKDEEELAPMLELGALKPRNILPRNLQFGIYRGGSSPEDLYTRIVNGIEGTPMPAAPLKPENPQGLSNEEVWDIVNYLLSFKPAASTHQAVRLTSKANADD